MIVEWSDRARLRLHDIHDYIAVDSPSAARHTVERLILRSAGLSRLPRVDRRVPEYPEADLREVFERPWRLIYRISESPIDIVTVKHYRQRLPSRPSAL
ncbi:type II toxin-antitoxin system RelE/ParE family toxin [Nevskia sp.]|uniref:type II toxin-antitoxin system RelE/ParE family toxin n=1 Tax=Nevskia sp. TaxID=1929292 RepID=UPI0025DF0560|nr:type II toxin-antitoxin system RelE/ParE family toxin [Nevskia sp.]